MSRDEQTIEVQGRRLRVSNLAKVMYPKTGFTKGQVVDYYIRIAPVLLPHLEGRPLTMKRYPNGVSGMHFYEKNCPSHRPDWVQTAQVWSEGNNRWMDYCMTQDLPTLVWTANLADLELHTSLSRAEKIDQPTVIAFDLDPGPPADIVQCCQVALWVRDLFLEFGMQSFAKTSGSKGLQAYVPLNTTTTFEETKAFAHELARALERQHPDLVVSDMKKALRVGKVLVDWSQNDVHKTTVTVYSLRAMEEPRVSTPVEWREVENCLKRRDPALLTFTSDQVLQRVQKHGDLFAPVLTLQQTLPSFETLSQDNSKSRTSSESLSGVTRKKPSPARKTGQVSAAKRPAKPKGTRTA